MNYQDLEREVKLKTDAKKHKSWRGPLNSEGLKNISWGDLKDLVQSK